MVPSVLCFFNQESPALLLPSCGDCSKTSNCISIEPLETKFGRKRKVNQSTCNKDFSCVDGFCPSFVTVQGATPRKRKITAASDLPMDIFNKLLLLINVWGEKGGVKFALRSS